MKKRKLRSYRFLFNYEEISTVVDFSKEFVALKSEKLRVPSVGFFHVVAKKGNELVFFNDKVEMFGSYEKAHLFILFRIAENKVEELKERFGIIAYVAIVDPTENEIIVLER